MRCQITSAVLILDECERRETEGEGEAENELPAISFRVLIFNHTTTQIQKC